MLKKFIKLIKKVDPVDLFFKGIKVAAVIGTGVILAMGIKSKFGNAEKVADSKTRSPNTEKPKTKATETETTEKAITETKSVTRDRNLKNFKNTLSRFADFAQSTISFLEATRYIFKSDDEDYRPYRPYSNNNFGYNGGGFNQSSNFYGNFGGSTCNRSTFISPIPNSIHRSGPLKDNEKRFLPLSELKTRPRMYTDCEINNPAGYLNVGETYRKYNIDGSYVDITRLSSNSNGISYESYNVDHTIA